MAEQIPAVRSGPYRLRIRRWYRRHGRRLPWRGIRDPYRIVVSEIMLQQTQVDRVLGKYPAFLRHFPSFAALARASRADVIRTWRGLGYNNRAVRLHRLAIDVRTAHGGRLPRSIDALTGLPGIGKYTAFAILCSAFDRRVPVVDINVRRLFSRIFWRMPSTDRLRREEEVWRLAWRILPRSGTYPWNQALMDLGAMICTGRAPRCTACPVADLCRSRRGMQRGEHRNDRTEPSWNGIPDRIHRGRIVKTLCARRRAMTVPELGSRISMAGRRPPKRWLDALLDRLEQDGVIRLTRRATPQRRRVSLA